MSSISFGVMVLKGNWIPARMSGFMVINRKKTVANVSSMPVKAKRSAAMSLLVMSSQVFTGKVKVR